MHPRWLDEFETFLRLEVCDGVVQQGHVLLGVDGMESVVQVRRHGCVLGGSKDGFEEVVENWVLTGIDRELEK